MNHTIGIFENLKIIIITYDLNKFKNYFRENNKIKYEIFTRNYQLIKFFKMSKKVYSLKEHKNNMSFDAGNVYNIFNNLKFNSFTKDKYWSKFSSVFMSLEN